MAVGNFGINRLSSDSKVITGNDQIKLNFILMTYLNWLTSGKLKIWPFMDISGQRDGSSIGRN